MFLPCAVWYHMGMPTKPEVIDLQALLAVRGSSTPSALRKMELRGDVVRFASQLPPGQAVVLPVPCWRRVRWQPCSELLIAEQRTAAANHVIAWHCPKCKASGTIERWQGTAADLRAMGRALPEDFGLVRVSIESLKALFRIARTDPELGRLAFTAQVDPSGRPVLRIPDAERARYRARLALEALRLGNGPLVDPLQAIIHDLGGASLVEMPQLSEADTARFLLDILALPDMAPPQFHRVSALGKPVRMRKLAKRDRTTLQIKVTLRDVRPPIWRRLLVPSDILLPQLHEVLQVAMGWQNCHLHLFRIRNECYAPPGDWEPVGYDSTKVVLADLAAAKGDRLVYEYDFGDGWTHDIVVEAVLPEPCEAPRCTGGRRRCPPEDCGGPWGYTEFLAAMAGKDVEGAEEIVQWYRGEFDPAEFDLEEVDAAVQAAGGR